MENPLPLNVTLPAGGLQSAVSVEAWAASDIGKSRGANEDAFLVATVRRGLCLEASNLPYVNLGPLSVDGTLMVVADGMGGEGSGDVASRIGIEGVLASLHGFLPWVDRKAAAVMNTSLNDVRAALGTAIVAGDSSILAAASDPSLSPTMGSTLTLAYLLFPTLYVAHVGDSRCYLHRESGISRLTHDHTLAEMMVRDGQVDGASPDDYANVLCNALGAGTRGAEAEVCKVTLQRGDAVLLCSDGLTKHVADEEIAGVLSAEASAKRACERLIVLTLERGGSDNVTVAVARVS